VEYGTTSFGTYACTRDRHACRCTAVDAASRAGRSGCSCAWHGSVADAIPR
jgi:hypothetical protein